MDKSLNITGRLLHNLLCVCMLPTLNELHLSNRVTFRELIIVKDILKLKPLNGIFSWKTIEIHSYKQATHSIFSTLQNFLKIQKLHPKTFWPQKKLASYSKVYAWTCKYLCKIDLILGIEGDSSYLYLHSCCTHGGYTSQIILRVLVAALAITASSLEVSL